MTAAAHWRAALPDLRGAWTEQAPIAPFTWFRAGGPAEVLFTPADEEDLALRSPALPAEVPVTVIGLGSNLIVRDGGVPGVVVRLGQGLRRDRGRGRARVRAGAAAPDVKVARAAADAAIDGLVLPPRHPGLDRRRLAR